MNKNRTWFLRWLLHYCWRNSTDNRRRNTRLTKTQPWRSSAWRNCPTSLLSTLNASTKTTFSSRKIKLLSISAWKVGHYCDFLCNTFSFEPRTCGVNVFSLNQLRTNGVIFWSYLARISRSVYRPWHEWIFIRQCERSISERDLYVRFNCQCCSWRRDNNRKLAETVDGQQRPIQSACSG